MPSSMTLKDAAEKYLEHLKAAGKTERTLYTYGRDVADFVGFFGEAKKLAALRPVDVGRFLKSDALLKLASGKLKADPTVKKTVRVLRMTLEWACQQGWITSVPFPKDAMPTRPRKQAGQTEAQGEADSQEAQAGE